MKRFYVDTSVIITLVNIRQAVQLGTLEGEVFIPDAVLSELLAERDSTRIAELTDEDIIGMGSPEDVYGENKPEKMVQQAAAHLGRSEGVNSDVSGDVALLSLGLADERGVIVTDDKPLRKTCKALGIPVSGSIGVLIAAVEGGDLDSGEAKQALVRMDEVGARLSARLLRRAERLIDDVAGSE